MSQANSTDQIDEEQKAPDSLEVEVLPSQSTLKGKMKEDVNEIGAAPAPVQSIIFSPLEPEHSRPSDDPIPPSQENIKKKETSPPLLGMSSYQSPYTGGRTFDYTKKYADEPLGEELKDNSRVFQVYLDEAENFDDDMMRGFRETIDSLLIFAALFSGVVTSFVIATISALQPDYSQITAVLLVEQVQILRAAGNTTAINAIPKSSVDLQNASVATDDLWINGLFLASLSLALVTALLSVLVKQWLQAYSSILAGSAQQKALIRQFRYNGLVKWKVPEIVGILPLILHTSLALFLIGLSLYISELHSSLSWIVVTVTSLAFAFYLGSLLMPQVWLECPYRIPLLFVPAGYIIYLSKALIWLSKWIIARLQDIIQTCRGKQPSYDPWTNSKKKNSFPSLLQASLKDVELVHLKNEDSHRSILEDILVWLLSLESNQSIQEILDQPIVRFLLCNWRSEYSKLENHADRAARAIWATLSKLPKSDLPKPNIEFPFHSPAFLSSKVGDSFMKGTTDHWNHLVSNNKSEIISKYFKCSKSKYLKELGITNKWKDDALLKAASNKDFEMTKVLVENGADVNAQEDKYWGNALQAAACGGNLDVIKFVVENNADVNAQGGQYGNALQAAAFQGNLDAVRFLVENNAEVNAQGGLFGNALQAAAWRGELDIVKYLVEQCAEVNAQGGLFGNALQAAAWRGKLDMVKFFVVKNADVNAQGEQYGNTLQAAAAGYKDSPDMIKFLVEHNAQGGCYGNTLQAAAYWGKLDIVKYLVEHGADVMAQGIHGTALQAAECGTYDEIAKFLERCTT